METENQTTNTKQNLNLARKWRPQNFDQIVGQDIPIRMLKNSLYLKKYFPVYLFAGQRGCGKTTTARVFAAAVNCQNLEAFQQQPTTKIPCLQCKSCMAMHATNHPDFIEIDAASHTGVDNVRQIIETSSYMPLAGKKKIYLIDEAHMLSKSAFNAFLKILEDPPETALFLLATTELHKFPETVLSRCFQLTFGPIKKNNLKPYLKQLCTHESIAIDDDALEILIEETDGSVRDALNLLEQVRFSHEQVTSQAVLHVLGKVSNTIPITMFSHVLEQNPTALLTYLQEISFHEFSAQPLWTMIVELCRALIWIKYGVETLPNSFDKNFNELIKLAAKGSIKRLYSTMQLMWEQEPLFLQTSNKHAFLELVLLQLCEQIPASNIHDMISKTSRHQAPPLSPSSPTRPSTTSYSTPASQPSQAQPAAEAVMPKPKKDSPWEKFIFKLQEDGKDPVLTSIFLQAKFAKHDETTGSITLQLKNTSKFLLDKVEESKTIWEHTIKQYFGNFSQFIYEKKPEQAAQTQPQTAPAAAQAPSYSAPQTQPYQPYKKKTPMSKPQQVVINVTDKEKWPTSNLIMSYFPGIIKKSYN